MKDGVIKILKILQGQRLEKPIVIPTPSFGLNTVLGGGIWSDRITLFWGNFSSGKTTLSLGTMAEAQELGFTPVIIDAEGTYTDEYAEKCGLDLDKRIYMRETIVEDILKAIVPLMQKRDEKYIFLIDSLNSIFFENFNKEADGGQAIGGSARVQKYLTAKIASYSHPNMAVLYISQQSVGFQGQTAFVGANVGNYTDHMVANKIKLFSSSGKDALIRDKDTGMILDQEITWTVEKSKQAPVRGVKGTYWFNPMTARLNVRKELFHYGVRCGVIKKGGPYYSFNDKKVLGADNFIEQMTEEDWEKLATVSVFIPDNEGVEDDSTE